MKTRDFQEAVIIQNFRFKDKNTSEYVLLFLISKKAQFPSIRITKQPILLTKSEINHLGFKFYTG